MRRSIRTAMIALGLTATLAGAAASPVSAAPPPRPTDRLVTAVGPTFVYNPAYGTVRTTVLAISVAGRTVVVLAVAGLPQVVWGRTLGAHVHVGRCGRDPNAAGAHYMNPNARPNATMRDREIWLDFKVMRGGWGLATTTAKWFIKPGAANSVIIHSMATDRTGNAGVRLVCTTVPFGHLPKPHAADH
jgi:Cu-Zn family superoxide dismutase